MCRLYKIQMKKYTQKNHPTFIANLVSIPRLFHFFQIRVYYLTPSYHFEELKTIFSIQTFTFPVKKGYAKKVCTKFVIKLLQRHIWIQLLLESLIINNGFLSNNQNDICHSNGIQRKNHKSST